MNTLSKLATIALLSSTSIFAATVFDAQNNVESELTSDKSIYCEVGSKYEDGLSFSLRKHSDFVVMQGDVLNQFDENGVNYTIDGSQRSFVFKGKTIKEVISSLSSNDNDMTYLVANEMKFAFKSLRIDQDDINFPTLNKMQKLFSKGCSTDTLLDLL